jgi:hypothetical protein
LFDKVLDKFEEDKQAEYLVIYGANTDNAVYNVQLQDGSPNIILCGNKVTAYAMAVYAFRSYVKLSSNLMEYIAPMSTVCSKSNIKFRPADMLYGKSFPNAGKMFADLLHEQNLYLEQYGDFVLGGLHKAVLNF